MRETETRSEHFCDLCGFACVPQHSKGVVFEPRFRARGSSSLSLRVLSPSFASRATKGVGIACVAFLEYVWQTTVRARVRVRIAIHVYLTRQHTRLCTCRQAQAAANCGGGRGPCRHKCSVIPTAYPRVRGRRYISILFHLRSGAAHTQRARQRRGYYCVLSLRSFRTRVPNNYLINTSIKNTHVCARGGRGLWLSVGSSSLTS